MARTSNKHHRYVALLVIIAADFLVADELTTVPTQPVDTSGQGGISVRTSTKLESQEEIVGTGGKAGSVVYRPYTYSDQRVYYQYPYQQPS